jgi:hypothetical protein
MQEQRERAHTILRKAFDEAGIVDGFYCGVLMDGTDVSAFNVGREGIIEYSNLERYQRLLGIVESCKHLLITQSHESQESL